MNNNYFNSGVFINSRKPSVFSLWDYQNVPQEKLADDVIKLANQKGQLIRFIAYHNWKQGNNKNTKNFLESRGLQCINVSNPIKNAVDFKITKDFSRVSSSYFSPDIYIIISGDQYVEMLIEDLPRTKK